MNTIQAVIGWPLHVKAALVCLVLIVLLMAYISVKLRQLEQAGRLMATLMGPWTRERPRARNTEKL